MNTIWIDETTGESYTQLLSYYFMLSGLPYPAPKVICVFVSQDQKKDRHLKSNYLIFGNLAYFLLQLFSVLCTSWCHLSSGHAHPHSSALQTSARDVSDTWKV